MLFFNFYVFVEIEGVGWKWLVGDYEVGDVVFYDVCK